MRLRYVIIIMMTLVMMLEVAIACGEKPARYPEPITPLWPLSELNSTATPRQSDAHRLASYEIVRKSLRRLTKWYVGLPFVQWSPDGRRIMFDYRSEGEGTSLALHAVNSDGTALRDVVEELDFLGIWSYFQSMQHFDITRDGSKVVYSTSGMLGTHSSAIEDMRRCMRFVEVDGETLWLNAKCGEDDPLAYTMGVADIDGTITAGLDIDRLDDPQPKWPSDWDYLKYPAWSPDGTEVAFRASRYSSGDPDDNACITITSSDLSDAQPLLKRTDLDKAYGTDKCSTLAAFPLTWSPDGKYISFLVEEGTHFGAGGQSPKGLSLYTVQRDGENPTRVSATLSRPAWSPTGNRLALARVQFDKLDVAIFTMEADGSAPRRIARIADIHTFYQVGGPFHREAPHHYVGPWLRTLSWSPDGTQILFSCEVGLCVVDLEGNLIGKSPPSEDPLVAAWSPDGSGIAIFNSGFTALGPFGDLTAPPEGSPVLYTMAPDGSDVQVLVRAGENGALVAEGAK